MTAFTAIEPARRELPEPDTEWARGRRMRAAPPKVDPANRPSQSSVGLTPE